MPGDKPRILIVDDEPQLRELLRDALGPELDVQSAASGEEALIAAKAIKPDLLVTDLCLGDCTGLEVIRRLRVMQPDMPAMLITGHAELADLSETSAQGSVEIFNKPLDMPRLKRAIASELSRLAGRERHGVRPSRASGADGDERRRETASHFNLRQKGQTIAVDDGHDDLAADYRKLNRKVGLQNIVMDFQRDLLLARDDDDVFKSLFGIFVHHSGPLFGAALVCDDEARLQLIGRFGVPGPDGPVFCLSLSAPVIDAMLADPRPTLIDAGEQADRFDPAIRRYLAGLTILAVPLVPSEGQMIGLVLLYRKGEQPFMESDVTLSQMISLPTALAVQRND